MHSRTAPSFVGKSKGADIWGWHPTDRSNVGLAHIPPHMEPDERNFERKSVFPHTRAVAEHNACLVEQFRSASATTLLVLLI